MQGLEQQIDDMTAAYRQNQMVRLRQGSCSDEACTLYSEMLTDFERIGDHILNIGQELANKGWLWGIPLEPIQGDSFSFLGNELPLTGHAKRTRKF